MANKTSQHILSTSSSLLGFCLFIITSIHFSSRTEGSIIDEFTSVIAVLLASACVFSFVSMKTANEKLEDKLELIADYIFLTALIGIVIIILLIAFNVVK